MRYSAACRPAPAEADVPDFDTRAGEAPSSAKVPAHPSWKPAWIYASYIEAASRPLMARHPADKPQPPSMLTPRCAASAAPGLDHRRDPVLLQVWHCSPLGTPTLSGCPWGCSRPTYPSPSSNHRQFTGGREFFFFFQVWRAMQHGQLPWHHLVG